MKGFGIVGFGKGLGCFTMPMGRGMRGTGRGI